MFLDEVFPRLTKRQKEYGTLSIQEFWNQIVPVNIQNVADYFYEHRNEWHNQKGELTLDGRFPNVRLPWPCCWFEWKNPAGIRMGIILIEHQLESPKTVQQIFKRFESTVNVQLTSMRLGSKFIPLDELGEIKDLRPLTQQKYDELVQTWVHGQCYLSGSIKGKSLAPQIVAYCHDSQGEMSEDWHLTIETLANMGDVTWLAPVWMAISFIHCKNTVINNKEPIPEKLQKARIKRGKAPLFQFKTLEIGATKRIIENVRTSQEGLSMPKALHICRGHFKDYRGGGGLFGRHKGLYWWDMHTRGNAQNGIIVKDYAVKLPEVGGVMNAKTD